MTVGKNISLQKFSYINSKNAMSYFDSKNGCFFQADVSKIDNISAGSINNEQINDKQSALKCKITELVNEVMTCPGIEVTKCQGSLDYEVPNGSASINVKLPIDVLRIILPNGQKKYLKPDINWITEEKTYGVPIYHMNVDFKNFLNELQNILSLTPHAQNQHHVENPTFSPKFPQTPTHVTPMCY